MSTVDLLILITCSFPERDESISGIPIARDLGGPGAAAWDEFSGNRKTFRDVDPTTLERRDAPAGLGGLGTRSGYVVGWDFAMRSSSAATAGLSMRPSATPIVSA